MWLRHFKLKAAMRMQSLLSEILIAEANSVVWHPECVGWVLSKVLTADPRGLGRRPEAVLNILGRCLIPSTGPLDSIPPKASYAGLAIQVINRNAQARADFRFHSSLGYIVLPCVPWPSGGGEGPEARSHAAPASRSYCCTFRRRGKTTAH